MKYRFSIDPVSAPRMTQSSKWNNKPQVVKYFKFKHAMKILALEQKFELPASFMVTFIIPVPPSVNKNERFKRLGHAHQNTPDIDNLLKAFMDALKKNDSHVHTVTAKKVWGMNGAIEVII